MIPLSLCSLVHCLPSFCGCSKQERWVTLSVLTPIHPPPPFFSCWPASAKPSQCVKHAFGSDVFVSSDSDDEKRRTLILSVRLSSSCQLLWNFFLHVSASVYRTSKHVCLRVSEYLRTFLHFFFECVFCCSALSSEFTDPTDLPLRIILPQCFIHLSNPHTPAASPVKQTPRLTNPILISPSGNNYHRNNLFTPLFVLPAWPA